MSNDELIAPGDALQSAASRMAEYVRQQSTEQGTPYEVHLAALEAESAVNRWTAVRRKSKPRGPRIIFKLLECRCGHRTWADQWEVPTLRSHCMASPWREIHTFVAVDNGPTLRPTPVDDG